MIPQTVVSARKFHWFQYLKETCKNLLPIVSVDLFFVFEIIVQS